VATECYKVAGLPLAAAGLLNLMIAGGAMAAVERVGRLELAAPVVLSHPT
jgi:hypothetical protein